MTEELKKRIAQINAGTAPKGYKKTKVGIVPEEWGICHFKKQFARLRRKNTEGNTNVLTISAQYGLINQEEFFKKEIASEDKSNYYLLYRGDFAYNKSYSNGYPFGAFKMLDRYDSGIVSPLYICFTPTESNVCPAFYVQYFENGMMNREIQAVAQEGARNHGLLNISIDDFFNSYLLCPPLPEQQKIAEILTAQDAVIALMQKQIELLQKQKKAFLQKMFPKKGCEYPEIRFSGFTGAWKQYHLGDLYIERNEKGNDSLPILSVSIRSGVSDDELDTEALGKIVRRSEDKSTYKHVFCGDLVFNMMRAWQGAIGVVKREGMVSPAYISAIPNEKVYPPFMNYLLRRKAAVDQINDLSYGVTDFRKRLYWKSFIRVSCQLPSLQEQKMITELFESLNALIDQHQRKLELEQQKKKALMQLLLTGKVRCIK